MYGIYVEKPTTVKSDSGMRDEPRSVLVGGQDPTAPRSEMFNAASDVLREETNRAGHGYRLVRAEDSVKRKAAEPSWLRTRQASRSALANRSRIVLPTRYGFLTSGNVLLGMFPRPSTLMAKQLDGHLAALSRKLVPEPLAQCAVAAQTMEFVHIYRAQIVRIAESQLNTAFHP